MDRRPRSKTMVRVGSCGAAAGALALVGCLGASRFSPSDPTGAAGTGGRGLGGTGGAPPGGTGGSPTTGTGGAVRMDVACGGSTGGTGGTPGRGIIYPPDLGTMVSAAPPPP